MDGETSFSPQPFLLASLCFADGFVQLFHLTITMGEPASSLDTERLKDVISIRTHPGDTRRRTDATAEHQQVKGRTRNCTALLWRKA